MPLANNAEDKIRRLQVKLYQAAKRSPDRRFHALYDKIYRRHAVCGGWNQTCSVRGRGPQVIFGDGQDRKTSVRD